MSAISLVGNRVRRTGVILAGIILGTLFIAACARDGGTPEAPPVATNRPAPSTQLSGPRISFDVQRIDLGDIPVGDRVPVTFVYHNTGDAPLVVDEHPAIEALEGC